MFGFYQEFKKSFGITAIVSILAGVLLLVYPQTTSRMACYLLGGIIFLQGILSLRNSLKAMSELVGGKLMLIWSLILMGLGAFFILRTDIIISIIPLIFGLFILASGVSDMFNSKQLKDTGYPKWWVTLLLATVKFGLGIIMVLNPFDAAVTMLMFIGGCLIYAGVSSLWTIYCLTKTSI